MTNDRIVQVPQRLIGFATRLDRADQTINDIDRGVKHYIANYSHRVIGQFESDPCKYIFRIYGRSEQLGGLSVVAGEVIHHFRASLDNLVCALAEEGGERINRSHSMPIKMSRKSFDKACESGCVAGLSPRALEIIEAAQPYHSPDPALNLLAIIDDLDIQDKHRGIFVSTSGAVLGDTITMGPNAEIARRHPSLSGKTPVIVHLAPPTFARITEEGAEFFHIRLAEPHPAFEADAKATIQVCIPVARGREWQEVVSLLRLMRHRVSSFVAEFFEEFEDGR